jgi:REP element-mobilizing transposase RayT
MARLNRIKIPGGLYHIMSRGNAKAPVFLDDGDRLKFIDILAKTIRDYGWLCHAYCLMGNHYHLMVETPDANLSSGMHLLNGMYTQAFNFRHQRTGHVFEGRFRSNLVEKELYLLELTRYIVLNPVRAGLTARPGDYRWSSYNATSGNARPPGFLHTSLILGHFGDSTAAYVDFVNDVAGVSGKELDSGRQIIGSEAFVEKNSELLPLPVSVMKHPDAKAVIERPSLQELFDDMPFGKKERNERIVSVFREFRYSKTEIAAATGLHLSSIGRILKS